MSRDDERGSSDITPPPDEVAAAGSPRHPVSRMVDIARASGVSQATVSRILSGAPTSVRIGQATRDRVITVARDLGYRLNPHARGLRGAPTMLLGLIVREITEPFFAGAIEALTAEAAARGYNVVLGHAHGRADEAIALRGVLETRHCDALLLVGDVGDQPSLLEDLRHSSLPMVGLWQGSPLPGIPTVNVDNRLGTYLALDELLRRGHRRIAFIGGRRIGDVRERRAAFRQYAKRHGLELPTGCVQLVDGSAEAGDAAMRALMTLPVPPTAVVASTDIVAIGALYAAADLGVRVPQDVSVIGFDDIPAARFSIPALTTLRQPVGEMAAVAVRIAIDLIGMHGEAPAASGPDHVLQPTLIERRSVGIAPA
jgi:DNA-binding LacI/PurR family transcriptional regulator